MILSGKQIKHLLSRWGLEPISYKKAKHGYVNHNWIVETRKGKFVLRGVHFYTKKEFAFWFRYLRYLKDNGFPYQVPAPVQSRRGGYVTKFKGNAFWLYGYIEGREGNDKFAATRGELAQVIKMVGALHRILVRNGIDSRTAVSDPLRLRGHAKQILAELNKAGRKRNRSRRENLLLRYGPQLIKTIGKIDDEQYFSCRYYNVHGDMNGSNLVWRGGRLIGLLDFDRSYYKHMLMRDLAVIILLYCWRRDRDWMVSLPKAVFILNEYKKYCKLTEKDVRSLPDLIAAYNVDVFNFVCWLMGNAPERADPEILGYNIRSAKWQVDNRDKIVDYLLKHTIKAA